MQQELESCLFYVPTEREVWLGGEGDIEQMKCFQRFTACNEVLRAQGKAVGAAGELCNRGSDAGGGHVIEFGRPATGIEPARVFVPCGAHVPRNLAVLLRERELGEAL